MISSTHLKGEGARCLRVCRATMKRIVATLRSPPLWWWGVSSLSCSRALYFTRIRTPYFPKSLCQHRFFQYSFPVFYSQFFFSVFFFQTFFRYSFCSIFLAFFFQWHHIIDFFCMVTEPVDHFNNTFLKHFI